MPRAVLLCAALLFFEKMKNVPFVPLICGMLMLAAGIGDTGGWDGGALLSLGIKGKALRVTRDYTFNSATDTYISRLLLNYAILKGGWKRCSYGQQNGFFGTAERRGHSPRRRRAAG